MSENLVTTKELANLTVVDGKKHKRIGKVRRFVFHPRERRCIGFLVKRPDAALMFHRSDMFVALDGFHLDDEGRVVVHDDPQATDRGAVKALGVNWDRCVIWVGMPVMTVSGEFLGFVDTVAFNRKTGEVGNLVTENGAANDALLGKRVIPANYIKGFKQGVGIALVQTDAYQGEDPNEHSERGAIVVSDAALDVPVEGGVAAAAGKATVLAADKAKKGADKAKKSAVKAKKVVDERLEEARPGAQKLAERAGEAVELGTFALGRQIGKASGAFAAFKEEFDKAANGGDSRTGEKRAGELRGETKNEGE